MNSSEIAPIVPTTDEPAFAAIDVDALDNVAGGCAACGTTSADGRAPTVGGAPSPANLLAAFAGR
jgi:hypothetical protein